MPAGVRDPSCTGACHSGGECKELCCGGCQNCPIPDVDAEWPEVSPLPEAEDEPRAVEDLPVVAPIGPENEDRASDAAQENCIICAEGDVVCAHEGLRPAA